MRSRQAQRTQQAEVLEIVVLDELHNHVLAGLDLRAVDGRNSKNVSRASDRQSRVLMNSTITSLLCWICSCEHAPLCEHSSADMAFEHDS